jgi:hypothetical protein
MADDEGIAVIDASVGDLELRVEGEDLETVRHTFEETWRERLAEVEQSTEAVRQLSRGYE